MQYFVCTGRLCDNPSITQGQISKRAYFQIAVSRDIRREGGARKQTFLIVSLLRKEQTLQRSI